MFCWEEPTNDRDKPILRRYKKLQWWFVYRWEAANPVAGHRASSAMVDAVRAYSTKEALQLAEIRNPVRRKQRLAVWPATKRQYEIALEARAIRSAQIRELKKALTD